MSEVSPARAIAFDVVRATFERDAFTDVTFREEAERRGLEGRERAQAQRLAFGAVQRRGTSDAAVERLAERSPRLLDPPVRAALRLGLYELLFSDATPDHAAVDQAVELVKGAGAAHAAGFANAVLRRAGRERGELLELLGDDSTPAAAAVAHSVPGWLADMWWRELGPDTARALLAACNEPPERALRVNTLRIDPDEAVAALEAAGMPAHRPRPDLPPAPQELVIVKGSLAGAVPMIERGELVPQSRGSAAVVDLLDPRPGEQVLDLCAGPGIKSGQIGARMEDRGEVISVEIERGRAAEVAGQAERLGLHSVTVIEGDAAELELGTEFDRVLVDAPCSDLGTLASRPDARWRKTPQTVERLAALQARILDRGVRALRPGGTLVYATCTISRRENEDRIAGLEDSGADFDVEDLGSRIPALAAAADGRCLQIRPDRDRTTGFFVARLRRHD